MAEDMIVAPGIVRNPERRGGRPTIQGTRIAVDDVLSALGTDPQAIEAVRRSYPHLTPENVQQAIRYAWTLVHALVPEMSEEELDRLAQEQNQSARQDASRAG